jgi:hypothetical protein
MRRRKYGNEPVEAFGIVFDSKREREEYLKLRERAESGEIVDLRVKPTYVLLEPFLYFGKRVRGMTFTPDFDYLDATGIRCVVEVKGGKATQTQAYKLREKLFKARYPHIFFEVVER